MNNTKREEEKKAIEKQFTEPNETKSFVFPINNGEKKQSLQTEEELQIKSIQLRNFQRQHKIKTNDLLFNSSKISTMTSGL